MQHSLHSTVATISTKSKTVYDKDEEYIVIDSFYHRFQAISLHLLLWPLAANPKQCQMTER